MCSCPGPSVHANVARFGLLGSVAISLHPANLSGSPLLHIVPHRVRKDSFYHISFTLDQCLLAYIKFMLAHLQFPHNSVAATHPIVPYSQCRPRQFNECSFIPYASPC